MNARLSDFAEHTQARGAAIAAPEGPDVPGVAADRPAADEAALMNMLRLLDHVRGSRTLTPVERAFVLGARAVFEELAQVCESLLTPPAPPPSVVPSLPASPAPQPSEAAEAPSPSRPRAPRRPTPGGAAPPH